MLTELRNRKGVRLVRASPAPHAASFREVRFSVFIIRSRVSWKMWGLSRLLILHSSSSEYRSMGFLFILWKDLTTRGGRRVSSRDDTQPEGSCSTRNVDATTWTDERAHQPQ